MASLSKSRYTAFSQCPKRMWLDINKPECANITSAVESRFENGVEVGELARGIFGNFTNAVVLKEDGTQNLTEMVKLTELLLSNNTPVVTEASFSFEDCFCSVDILKNVFFNEYELYEVKSTTYKPGDEKDLQKKIETYLPDIAYQKWVLTKLGYIISSANLICINADYVLPSNGIIVLSDLFTIINMNEYITTNELNFVEERVNEAKLYINETEDIEYSLGMQCKKPYDCPFINYCIEHNGLKYPSVMNLYRAQWKKKIEYLSKGIITFEDVKGLVKSETQKMQIDCTLNNKKRINKDGIRDFLSTLSYPLYLLDFETMQSPIPEFPGTKPYQQIPFQYSLHVMNTENGNDLEHYEFLGNPDEDPRRALAEQLCHDIPKDVCVLAYNKSFEMTRISEMAQAFPDLAEHLLNIRDNIKDLMDPFQKCCYYVPEMKDSFSIKSVLPALFPDNEELNYHNLNESVQNGSQAMNAFPAMRHMNESERAQMRKNLLAYCCLDTLAMVRVLEKLYEAINDTMFVGDYV